MARGKKSGAEIKTRTIEVITSKAASVEVHTMERRKRMRLVTYLSFLIVFFFFGSSGHTTPSRG